MSYARVIPRDLFNEANLLKCLGKLYLNLENLRGHSAKLIGPDSDDDFGIIQDQHSGNLQARNVTLWVRERQVFLSRPLNSRDEWPLWATWGNDADEDEDQGECLVFNENGMFSAEMLALLTRGA